MSENLKRFFESVSKDEGLQEKMKALSVDRENAVEYIIALAKEIDIELCEADFKASEEELSEEELGAVSGGMGSSGGCTNSACWCTVGGGGGGRMLDDNSAFGCACAVYGQGGDGKDDHQVCICVVVGEGD